VGRSDTFKNLKQKRDLSRIFEQISDTYKLELEALKADPNRAPLTLGQIDMDTIALQFIL